ncbi:MAG: hypothetical protein EAY81_01400 [Bacteroidetes bacterium]|nr:MAG: hypothetical protein EAY81_01400 [Bacteroidota bacterium]
MKLSQVKALLPTINQVVFKLENGVVVPEHFHITEVGMVTKHFIDCGGTIRNEKTVNFQLWNANDIEHRLTPTKLLHIIRLSEEKLGMDDVDIEVEYQTQTIGKYDLGFDGKHFILLAKQTACLATDSCGIPQEKQRVNLAEIAIPTVCKPGGGCC